MQTVICACLIESRGRGRKHAAGRKAAYLVLRGGALQLVGKSTSSPSDPHAWDGSTAMARTKSTATGPRRGLPGGGGCGQERQPLALYVSAEEVLALAATRATVLPAAAPAPLQPSVDALPAVADALRQACVHAGVTHSAGQTSLLMRELYRVLYCASITGGAVTLLPPRLAACWHELLVDTDDYALLCATLGGVVLTHSTRSTYELGSAVASLHNTYRRVYACDPEPWCWAPRVLGDAQLVKAGMTMTMMMMMMMCRHRQWERSGD
jgi:hypothetical protein